MIENFYPWLIFFTVLFNALFVMSEFVLIRILRPKLSQLGDDKGNFNSKYIQKISLDLNASIFSSQIGISATTITFGALTFFVFIDFYNTILSDWNINEILLSILSVFSAFTIVVSFYSFIAEYLPKLIAAGNISKVAKLIAPFIYYFSFITYPLRFVIKYLSVLLFKLFNINFTSIIYNPVYSEEELKLILERSKSSGMIEQSEHQMINRIFDFTDKTAKEILTPRINVIAISTEESIEDFLIKAKKSKFSKFPIYKDNLENIIGVLHLKELAFTDYKVDDFDITQIKRRFISIHEGMKLHLILQKMKKKFSHLAVVYDEFGVFAGILTLEDVLGALVGTLNEEIDDQQSKQFQEVSSNIYRVNPSTKISEFNKMLNVKLNSETSAVLSGFILEYLDDLPSESTEFIVDEIKFFDFKMSGNRITDFFIRVKSRHHTDYLKETLNF